MVDFPKGIALNWGVYSEDVLFGILVRPWSKSKISTGWAQTPRVGVQVSDKQTRSSRTRCSTPTWRKNESLAKKQLHNLFLENFQWTESLPEVIHRQHGRP
jgi:hypothetical protein